MKKIFLIILSLLSLVACLSGSIDRIDEAIKVENIVKIYIDNLSSQNIGGTIKLDSNNVTFGGITIPQNTTGSFIEVDFTKDSNTAKGERYGIDLLITTSDSAINEYGVTSYNKRTDGIYMRDPRPKMIIKDSQSTESVFEVTRESY